MEKKRSKIIKDLIMDDINALQAMHSLDLMLEDMDKSEIKNWVNNELNGYQKKDDIPQYRKINAVLMGNVQFGSRLYKNMNIPLSDIEAIKMFNQVEIRDPISKIIQMAKAENETEEHCLLLVANTILVNHYQETNGDVISAYRKLGLYAYNNILAVIKDKLIEVFKLLEKNYGNLDKLYIDFSDNSKKDIIKELGTIVYNDNSINIGDNNQLKESIVGDKNEN